MMQKWYYSTGGATNGPVTVAELKELARSGRLAPTDMVRRDDMDKWHPAAKVKGLFDAPVPPTQAVEPPVPGPDPTVPPAPTEVERPGSVGRTGLRARWGKLSGKQKAGVIGGGVFFLVLLGAVADQGKNGPGESGKSSYGWGADGSGRGEEDADPKVAKRQSGSGKGKLIAPEGSFTAKAIDVTGDQNRPGVELLPGKPRSRQDFINALIVLGGTVGHRLNEKGVEVVQVVLVCEQGRWHQVFGNPQRLADGFDTFLKRNYQMWRHQCSDGPITLHGNVISPASPPRYSTSAAYLE